VVIGASTPRLTLSLIGGLEYAFFEGQDGLDSFDQRVNTTAAYAAERQRLAGSVGVNRATTRTTEDLDTGLDFTDARVLSVNGTGSWTYVLSQRNSMGLRGGVRRTTYDTDLLDDFVNYSGSVFFGRQMSEKDTFEVSTTYTRFETTSGLDNVSNAIAGTASWTHIFNPRAELSGNIGVNHVRVDEDVDRGGTIVSEDDSRTGAQGGATFTWRSERTTINTSFQSGLSPSGRGELDDRNTLNVTSTYLATPVISLDLALIFINTGAVTGSDNQRNFFSVEPGARWQFLPDWDARLAYKFRTQKFEDENEWARSNGVRASVTYRMPVKRF
ncbi:MAG: hypothetical protein MJE12_00925, partial [Alphaproteobacteria bacterium]|nr:hypothetical protein [Alphaproteobacteria bacterium]